MNVNYGGKQSIPKAFTTTARCLGPNSPTLKMGDMQHLASVAHMSLAPALTRLKSTFQTLRRRSALA